MTTRELAVYCGVSPATISRYFNYPSSLSSETRDRIKNAVAETGFSKVRSGKRSKKSGAGIICAILPGWDHSFSRDLLQALQAETVRTHRKLIAFSNDCEDKELLSDLIVQLKPEGIVLLYEEDNSPLYSLLPKLKIPACMCSAPAPNMYFSNVRIDDIAASYEATNYLIRLGHKKIGIISDHPDKITSGFQRIAGSRKALTDAGLQLPDEQIAYAGSSFEDGKKGMEELLKRDLGITAVFALSDDMAYGAVSALQDHGLQVPEDISVMGFDDGKIASEKCRPRLTTVRQPIDRMAKYCIDTILFGRADSSLIVDYSIVVRDSCRKISQTD